MVKISAAALGLLLMTLAVQDKPASPAVSIEMRNVRLHVSSDAVMDVKWLKGSLVSPAGHIPVFDDQNSYTMEIDDGEMALEPSSLTALVNHAFDYKGSALSDLRITIEDGHLIQRGTLKKGLSVPFTITADVAATPDGRRALGFSILVNGKKLPMARARRLQDQIVAALLGHLDGA